MNCPKCGNLLPDDSVFCQYCGSKIEQVCESNPGQAMQSRSEEIRTEIQTTIEFSTLSEINEKYLQGDLPVLLEKVLLQKGNDGTIRAVCSFISLSDKTISAMLVNVKCFDIWRENLKSVKGYQYLDLTVKRDQIFGENEGIVLPDSKTRVVEVQVQKIVLSDGTLLTRNGDNIKLIEPHSLVETIGQELYTEYKAETYQNAYYEPDVIGHIWRCTCGALNGDDEKKCHKCGDLLEVLLSKRNTDALRFNVNEKKRIQKEKEEKERLEEEKKIKLQEELQRIQKEREEAERRRIEEEKRKAADEEARKKEILRKKRNKRMAVILSSAAVLALLVYCIGWQIIPSSKYKEAEAMLDSGDIELAYEQFLDISNYKDSQTRAYEIRYTQAEEALKNKEYDIAYNYFNDAFDYKDSETKASEAQYQKALSLSESGNYKESAELFEKLGYYKNSENCVKEAYYLYAKQLIEQENLHEAYLVLSEKINVNNASYEDSIELANQSEYQYANDCYSIENYEEAYKSFLSIKTYKDSEKLLQQAGYEYGNELLEDQAYQKAEDIFTAIGKYKNSTTLAKEAKYQRGLVLQKEKKYPEAETLFAELGNYSDSTKQIKETKYLHAAEYEKDGELCKAVDLYKELGNYSDSAEKYKATMWTYVTEHKNNDDMTTYEYLKILKKSNYQDSKQYYEDLYTWKITGYVNTSSSDTKTKLASVTSFTENVTFHYKITGGAPDERITLYHVIVWPGGSYSKQDYTWDNLCDGSTFSSSWDGYFWDNPTKDGRDGTLMSKVYDKSTGKLIGTVSVEVND